MKMKKKIKAIRQKISSMNYDLLIQFAAPYLLILLVLIILSVTITSSTFYSQLDQSMDYSKLCLNASMDRIEDSMTTVHALHDILLNYDPLVKVASASEKGKSNTRSLLEMRKALLVYDDSLNILQNYAVYCYRTGVTVTQERIITNSERMYDSFLLHGDMSYDEWANTILARRQKSCYFAAESVYPGNYEATRSIVYTMPFIDLSTGTAIGQTLYYLDEQEILSLIEDAFDGQNVFVQLLSGDQLLTVSGDAAMNGTVSLTDSDSNGYEKIDIGGEEYYVAYVDSDAFNLRLLIGVPGSVLTAQCRERLELPYSLRNILIVLTVAIAVFTIFKNRQPLMGISEHIEEGGSISLSGVEQAVRTMKIDRANLNLMMESQKRQLQEALFRQLVYGISGNEAQMEIQLEYVGVKIGGEQFKARALYLLMQESSDEVAPESLLSGENHRFLVNNLLMQYSERFIPLLLENRNQIAILYIVDDENELAPVSELYRQIELETGIRVNFYLGGSFTQLRHARHSFTEARRLMLSDTLQKERFLAVSDSKEYMNTFEYTAAEEELLLNLIDKNAAEEIDALLDRIYHNNFVKRSLSASMCEMLYYRLLSTVVQKDSTPRITDPELAAPRGDTNPGKFFRAFRQHIGKLCDLAEQKKQEARRQIDDDILAFVNENITNNQLSICMLAMRYGRSESYLSVRFKEKAGMTFSNYVEQMRVRLASEMLAERGSSITEISERVGYNSSSAFGRAYKRVMGCTPSEYQAMLSEE